MKVLVPPLQAFEEVKDSDLKNPPDKGSHKVRVTRYGLNTRIINCLVDSTFGKVKLKQILMFALLQRFPLLDRLDDLSDEDYPKLLAETELDTVLPDSIDSPFLDPASDEGLTRQGFYGLASHLVDEVSPHECNVPDGAVFKVDLMTMQGLEVRPGFSRYGAVCYYDESCKPLAIRTAESNGLVYPSEGQNWQVAKFAWRCTVVTYVTIVDHLFNGHFNTAAQMLRASREALGENHPIKRVLAPFLMRTAMVNNKASLSLLSHKSIMHHTSSLTWDSMRRVAEQTYQQGDEWRNFQERVNEKGPKLQALIENGKLPFYEDGIDVYLCFYQFFERCFVNLAEEDFVKDMELQDFWQRLGRYTNSMAKGIWKDLRKEHLIETLANFAFHVTAFHQEVGQISDSIETPLHGGGRIRPGATRVDKQAFVGSTVIMALTALKVPKLLGSTFDQYWGEDEEHLRQSWDQMQRDLKKLSKKIDRRNDMRDFPYRHCHPRNLKCSVAV